MQNIFFLNEWPVRPVLDILLQDKTTKKNIIFATDSYGALGDEFQEKSEMTVTKLLGIDSFEIQPRVIKSREHQAARTKKKAEVFTPAWVCCLMNNYMDEEWFGYPDVFNHLEDQSWEVKGESIPFPENKTWMAYIDSTILEITCGEAPFLVSRYDAATGEWIELKDRIGVLDRKLRIVNENVRDEAEWMSWVIRAYQCIYGYEYQGDNLLIARINLLMTFVENVQERWGRDPEINELEKIADIISWNLWQMDGLTGMVPLLEKEVKEQQMSLFGMFGGMDAEPEKEKIPCRIYDWREGHSLEFNSMKEVE